MNVRRTSAVSHDHFSNLHDDHCNPAIKRKPNKSWRHYLVPTLLLRYSFSHSRCYLLPTILPFKSVGLLEFPVDIMKFFQKTKFRADDTVRTRAAELTLRQSIYPLFLGKDTLPASIGNSANCRSSHHPVFPMGKHPMTQVRSRHC